MLRAGKFAQLFLKPQEWGLRRLDALSSRNLAPHLATGILGERAALFELRRRGYVIVARRWTNPRMRGDLDLVGWQSDSLCFIEVKTRTARDFSPAEAAVDEDKRHTIRRLARIYLKSFPESERRSIGVRFDVVSVYTLGSLTEFEIFPNAFGWH